MLHTDNIDTGKVFKMSYNKLKPFLSIFTAAALHKPINNSSFLKYFSYILLPFLCSTPPAEGFPWDDLRKIFGGCQWMAKGT